ncbi:MAG: hypothetical protein E7Z93_04175 [Cyanobacteria bacterium SIG32]|nr:hypothetical protein [Cyanobacteria bacterium SIG32]
MAKTLNELSREMRDFIVELQSDAHNITGFKKYRYNNLKIEVLDPRTSTFPQARVTIGMSAAVFNIATLEKISGGLGPDERYVLRWFMRETNLQEVKEAWRRAEKRIGKAQGSDES